MEHHFTVNITDNCTFHQGTEMFFSVQNRERYQREAEAFGLGVGTAAHGVQTTTQSAGRQAPLQISSHPLVKPASKKAGLGMLLT